MSFVALTTAQTDADSPINETLMTQIKDNFDALYAAQVTNGDSHNHSGGDGATIGTDGVVQGSLKTTTHAVSTTSTTGEVLVLNGGSYGFRHQFKNSGAGNTNGDLEFSTASTSYTTAIALKVSAGTGYAQQRYIQASPPYKIGGHEWNHFLYALINSGGEILAASEAEDPPYAYNGPPQNLKDSLERIMAVPHPFVNYFERDPAADGLEIVLFDLREKDTKRWRGDMEKEGKIILEDLAGNVNPAGIILPSQSLGLPDIPGFTDRVKIRR